MPEDRDALVEEPWQAFRRFCHPPLYWFDESGWKARFAALASILPPSASAGDMLNECIAEIGGDVFVAERDDEGLWAVRTLDAWCCLNQPSAGDGELVAENARLRQRIELLDEGKLTEAALSMARDEYRALYAARVRELEEALTKARCRFVSLSATAVLEDRPALEAKIDEFVADIDAALNPSPTEQGGPG